MRVIACYVSHINNSNITIQECFIKIKLIFIKFFKNNKATEKIFPAICPGASGKTVSTGRQNKTHHSKNEQCVITSVYLSRIKPVQ